MHDRIQHTRGLVLITAVAFVLSACNLPSLFPPQLDSRMGCLDQGALISYSPFRLHWTPINFASNYFDDHWDLEILDYTGAVVGSYTEEANYWVRHNGVYEILHLTSSGPSGDINNERDLHVSCGQTYRWHVRQREGDQVSGWSQQWTFRIGNAPGSAPSLTSPADGAHINGGVISFNPLTGDYPGITYILEIAKDAPDANILDFPPRGNILSMDSSGPVAIFIGMFTGHTYYWRVRAMYPPDCNGPWSAMRSFVWTGPNAYDSGGGMEPPAPICPLENCEDETSTPTITRTPLSFSILTQPPNLIVTPLRSTRTNTPQPPTPTHTMPVPTLTFPPPAPTPTYTMPAPTLTFTPIPLVCSDFSDRKKCEMSGCYWWSGGYCKPEKEPPPPPDCSSYTTQATCPQASCVWNEKDNTCNNP